MSTLYYEIKRAQRLGKKQCKGRSKERAVFTDNVDKQETPLFEVQSCDTVIDYTNDALDSAKSFAQANRPKKIIRINGLGHRTLIKSENFFGK